jgi:DNA repair photolyase
MVEAAAAIRRTEAKSILSQTSGFIAEAGFTHSLTPARNCTFGCTYCYVPTMRIQGGLQPEDWQRWGQFTTIKTNAAELLSRAVQSGQRIYCSPMVDPYQPAEVEASLMPGILDALIAAPGERLPKVFVIQTRGPLILRDLGRLVELAARTTLRVSFSLTTNREDVRCLYEPRCVPFPERRATIRALRQAGIETYATLAPLLPCDPEILAAAAIEASGRPLIGDPLHVRAVKLRGATTRDAAFRIADAHGHQAWFDPAYQEEVAGRIDTVARAAGFSFTTGTRGFSMLAS